ncbi:hypothetical protein FPRO06_04514 [Fusarium proliferatum]|nr:hypothetical protein FPRO06_04514 [Fusarium proliferatum]
MKLDKLDGAGLSFMNHRRGQEKAINGNIPSHPKLVARSGIEDKPWSARYEGGWTVQKTIDPIGNHAIVPLWNKADSDLRTGIIATLKDLNWTAINILRLGYARCLNTLDGTDDMLPKLLISVQPESTSLQSGYKATMQCRQVLREHGIKDVEVEMMEAWVSRCNSPRLTSQPITEQIQETAQLSEFLGASIASKASPTCEGTKGFYVRLKDTDKLFAVTCRHALLDTFPNVDYHHSGDAPNMVIQPGQGKNKDMVESLASFIKMLEECFDTLTPAEVEELRILRGLKANYDQINDLESRIIGHVLFSPECSPSTSTPNVTWIRDWALVELHPDRHETALSELKNRVVAGPRANGQLFQALFHELSADHLTHFEGRFVDYPTNTYELTRPVAQKREVRQPFEAARNQKNEPPMVVAKFGPTTGLTFGVANEAKSILRKILAGETVVSDEWCIVGQKKKGLCRDVFSSKGDSGACILDMYGQVAGMLTSVMEAQNEDAFDITYATPIEWLLKDIRSYGLEVTLA